MNETALRAFVSLVFTFCSTWSPLRAYCSLPRAQRGSVSEQPAAVYCLSPSPGHDRRGVGEAPGAPGATG